MKIKKIPSQWLTENGYRMDCNPYMSGANEARAMLDKLECKKQSLNDLTKGYNGGIYNGPVFKRRYVQSSEYGVPFLTSATMLRADLSVAPYLSKVDAKSKALSYLELKPGMIMISCSGAIGNMVYVRQDMDGFWSCQDQLKVVADDEKIQSGYLYAFLKSKYGLPIVISGTYGAIIQHIEPPHIANLPVPRLGAEIEGEAHRLVEEAAKLRAGANSSIREVSNRFDELIKEVRLDLPSPRISKVSSNLMQKRLDAQFHDVVVLEIKKKIKELEYCTIGDWCTTTFLPGIFKRIYTDSKEFGTPYYTGASLFWLEPQAKGLLSRQTSKFDEVYLEKGTILVQAFGQDGGLTGRSVWVGDNLDKTTTTHMLVRLRADSLEDTAYLFGYLQSNAAYKQIACLTYGGSIPHFDESAISTVLVPILEDDVRKQLATKTLKAMEDRDLALVLERKARSLVEQSIEQAAKLES